MTGAVAGRHLTGSAVGAAAELPQFVSLVRAPNPGPMTLDGTNTWVLRAPGSTECVVVDPGPDDDGHLRAVAAAGQVALVLSTHGHPDHVAGLNRFAAMTGAPARAVDPAYCHDAPPLDGDARMTVAGLVIRAVATPGHTADSVSLLVEAPGGGAAVLTGDTILGRGTTIVAWPDGDLTAYLASLERLVAVSGAVTPALPGHGPALADCAAAAEHYLAHRRARLEQVRAAVAAGARDAGEVVARVYADVDRALWPAAELTVRAQLAHLAIPLPGDERPHSGAGGDERRPASDGGEEIATPQRLDRP